MNLLRPVVFSLLAGAFALGLLFAPGCTPSNTSPFGSFSITATATPTTTATATATATATPSPTPTSSLSPVAAVAAAAACPPGTRVFDLINDCGQTIWVGAIDLIPGGWQLDAGPASCTDTNQCPSGQNCDATSGQCVRTLCAPDTFSGRIWPRTGCTFGSSNLCPTAGVDCCGTGGCVADGSGDFGLDCGGSGAGPSTVAEFKLGTVDTYDVSVVDGFNVPIEVTPVGSFASCSSANCDYWCTSPGCADNGCVAGTSLGACDWNALGGGNCPASLQKVNSGAQIVGCQAQDPGASDAQSQVNLFKLACPTALGSASDTVTSTFTCQDAGRVNHIGYKITFCPK